MAGFFKAAINALMEARQREAARYVNGVLLSLDDATLKANGFTREDLKKRGSSYSFV
ncbi:hypothetical protein [Mesorhizobium sp. YR577]|jgi:hypothetical protein|uniref:hypothetical protein n=1 Tax=Mesorhizobium sp. YR577 TaxID=1884373 RepID=UPI001587C5C3|nr:hypothetical protein [Mesorhizobium sp. YR577]